MVVLFDPLQYPLARAILAAAGEPCELWYRRGERAEADPAAGAALRARATRLHERAAERASLTFAASAELVRQEGLAGHRALLVPPAADAFPAPDPLPEAGGPVVAVALGPFGRQTDWALLRGVAETLGDRLVLLLAGERDDRAVRGDADHAACLEHPASSGSDRATRPGRPAWCWRPTSPWRHCGATRSPRRRPRSPSWRPHDWAVGP